MKYFRYFLIGALCATVLYFMSGCATEKIFGKTATAEAKAKANVENVEFQLGENLQAKFDQLANITFGIGYSLNKESNPSSAVETARMLNERASSITGAPSLDEMKKMREMVDNLTSELATERAKGKVALDAKDLEITTLQTKSKLLADAKDAEIRKYMKQAQDVAMKADAIQSKLDQMDGLFGLGAVWYGAKKFVVSMSWFIGIGSILYLILRFASMSNPLAASIFSIFDTIMSWFVHLIQVVAPKALQVAGQTATGVANAYRDAMTKMIDNIEALQEMQKRDPTKKYTIDELLAELSKSMDSDEKAMITKIKRNIGYIS